MSATETGVYDDRIDAGPRRSRFPSGLLRLASDERLVELLRGRGSEAAFEALYVRHHRGVLSFCRHMLGSVDEAEDAVQHTFLAAYRDIVGSGKELRVRPWLYAIARNRCLTVLRLRREQAGHEVVEPSTEHLSHEVERRYELRALLGDFAGLPDDQRAALVLAELGDMSHDEIGQALGCPREKVKALVFQARSSLIASREAREAPCTEIREQLANLRGGALRRNLLRRHLRECPGCRDFRDKVAAQRRELALVLPVVPSLGLKAAVLGGVGAGAAAAGGGSVGSVVATATVVLAVAGGGTAAVEATRDKGDPPRAKAARAAGVAAPASAAGAGAAPASAAGAAEPVASPEPAAVERPAPTTRRGSGADERSRPGRGRPARRGADGGRDPRAAVVPGGGVAPEETRGSARGKGPPAERPGQSGSPSGTRGAEREKPRSSKPVKEAGKVRAPKPEKVRAPKPEKVRAPEPEKVKAPRPERVTGPTPEPVEPAPPAVVDAVPGQEVEAVVDERLRPRTRPTPARAGGDGG